jgi:uncharacterized protein
MITRRTFLKAAGWFGGSTLAATAYAFGVEPMLWLRTVEYKLTPGNWPKDFRLRMVVLSDIHAVDPWMPAARINSIVDHANSLNGDIILLLGDYVSGTRWFRREGLASEWGPALGRLKSPLGVHAIMGNHDWWEDRTAMQTGQGPTIAQKALEANGINVLENGATRLVHAGKPFWLAGLGDQLALVGAFRRRGVHAPPGYRRGVDDLGKTLAAITDDAPAILMAHEPDIFPNVTDRFALTMSGHTHGGQINLFGWRPVSASVRSRLYPRGHYKERGRELLVSSGLGCSILPIRVGVPPEVMVVELGG